MIKRSLFSVIALAQISAMAHNIGLPFLMPEIGPSKIFIVQNIATEKTRVYERCTEAPGCDHKLLMEADMLVGRRKKDDLNTQAGSFKISNWIKFYQDAGKKYPSWYDPSFPALPKPGSGFGAWTSKSLLPKDYSNAEMRGGFGWFAGILTPSTTGQWLHGTYGWGADGNKFIEKAKGGFINIFADLRSHGCTRHENGATAYLQQIVPAGTEVYRVYALEALGDVTRSRYQGYQNPYAYNYILTKDDVRSKTPHDSSVQTFINLGLSNDMILEKGTYMVDRYPDANLLQNIRASSGKSGNVYDIKESNFVGRFNVDTGKFINYKHPVEIQVDGIKGAAAFPSDIFTVGY